MKRSKEISMKTFKELRQMTEEIVDSENVGGFDHQLHKTPFGYQVRIYNSHGELHHTDMTKNTESKGRDSLADNVAQTKKQLRIK
jgi:hypothetical protein